MDRSLISKFDKMLDKEAREIVAKLIDLYNKHTKVKKSYGELVASLTKKELVYYITELELRTYKYLPSDLTTDSTCTYSLIDRDSDTKRHLTNYAKWCNKNREKNHLEVARNMVDDLIKDIDNNTKKGLAELVSDYMPKYFIGHYDSVDSRTVIMLLEKEFKKKGYVVVSLMPFKLEKVSKYYEKKVY